MKLRLYRSIRQREKTGITSILPDGAMSMNDLNLPNEIYLHILSSHKSKAYPEGRKLIYSFTDSYEKAKHYIQKYPEFYCEVRYVDINVEKNKFVLNNNIIFCKRTFTFEDWIDLIIKYKVNEFKSLTYNSKSVPYTNIFGTCSKNALSWSRASREYCVIASNLLLNRIDENKYVELNNLSQCEEIIYHNEPNIKYVKERCENMIDEIFKININATKKQELQKAVERYLKSIG